VLVDDACMNGGAPDIKKVDPIIYATGSSEYYHVGEPIAKAFCVGKDLKK
jgi:hypothetical protein